MNLPQVIEVRIRRLQVGYLKEARCQGAYFQFSDGPDDPDDEAGRYCGHVTGNTTRYICFFHRLRTYIYISLSFLLFSSFLFPLPSRLDFKPHRGSIKVSRSRASPISQVVSATWPRSDDRPALGRLVRLGDPHRLLRPVLRSADAPGGRASSRLLRVRVAERVSRRVHGPGRAQVLQAYLARLPRRLPARD